MKNYLKPELTIVKLDSADIIATSGDFIDPSVNGQQPGDLTDD